jgi:hypothetical protein
MNHNKECYLRHRGKGWEPATTYHRYALSLYEELQGDKRTRRADPILICTTKYDGSIFMANFRKKSPAVYAFQETTSDMGAGEEEVEIMFCSVSLPSCVK